MSRIQAFEFTDLPWYPQAFRQIQTDYLQFAANLGSGHQNLLPLFQKALQKGGTTEIVDLCSGAGGPWLRLLEQLEQAGMPVHVRLTDLYPHPDSIERWSRTTQNHIQYLAEPVDATAVPEHLKGMRTLFEGFHHFKPDQARKLLQNAVTGRAAIGIFEASFKPPLGWLLLILSPLITMLSYLVLTPFITPRTVSRFFFTYLIPVVPLATCWDGILSLLRVYSIQELAALANSFPHPNYTWEIGQATTGTPVFVFTYLVGYPEEDSDGDDEIRSLKMKSSSITGDP